MRRATIWSVGISTHSNNSRGVESSVPRTAGTRALLLPLAFTFALAALAIIAPLRQNPKVLAAFLGAAAALCAWNAALLVWARRSGRTLTLEVVAEKTALPASVRAGLGAVVLGLVLASGLRFCAVHRRPTAFRVRVRHAAGLVEARHLLSRLRSVSRHLQHQSVSLVQAGLVLSPVRDGGGRAVRERTDSLE